MPIIFINFFYAMLVFLLLATIMRKLKDRFRPNPFYSELFYKLNLSDIKSINYNFILNLNLIPSILTTVNIF